MSDIKIIYLDDSEHADYEALNKGYRNDVYVRVLNDVYSLHVYSIVRLKQDFETEVEA